MTTLPYSAYPTTSLIFSEGLFTPPPTMIFVVGESPQLHHLVIRNETEVEKLFEITLSEQARGYLTIPNTDRMVTVRGGSQSTIHVTFNKERGRGKKADSALLYLRVKVESAPRTHVAIDVQIRFTKNGRDWSPSPASGPKVAPDASLSKKKKKDQKKK